MLVPRVGLRCAAHFERAPVVGLVVVQPRAKTTQSRPGLVSAFWQRIQTSMSSDMTMPDGEWLLLLLLSAARHISSGAPLSLSGMMTFSVQSTETGFIRRICWVRYWIDHCG